MRINDARDLIVRETAKAGCPVSPELAAYIAVLLSHVGHATRFTHPPGTIALMHRERYDGNVVSRNDDDDTTGS